MRTRQIVMCASVWKSWAVLLLILFPMRGAGQEEGGLHSPQLATQVEQLAKDKPYVAIVYDFLKSYEDTLRALSGKELAQRLEYDGVEVVQGGFDRLHLVDEHATISFLSTKGMYGVSIRSRDFPILEVKFPSSCQLLTGKPLRVLEREFLDSLRRFHYDGKATVSLREEALTPLEQEGFYVLKGDAYHLESIRSDTYWEKADGRGFVPLFSADHLTESIGNLLLCESTPAEVELRLVVRQYGFKKHELAMPMRDWVAYCHSQGCTLYWGVESMEAESLTASVFVVNDVLSYDHVMTVEVPYAVLTDRDAIVQGDVNVFVPTHNITTLFQEYEENRE
mgnify:CR=1 FL=1